MIIGEDYIAKAFEFARESVPDAQLYYNDYSLEKPAKREGAVALIRRLQERGAPVYRVGLQGHNRLAWPSVEEQDATIAVFAALGVKVMITELDLDVLPSPKRDETADVSERGSNDPEGERKGSILRHRPCAEGRHQDDEQRGISRRIRSCRMVNAGSLMGRPARAG